MSIVVLFSPKKDSGFHINYQNMGFKSPKANPNPHKTILASNMELFYNCFCVAGFIAAGMWCIVTFAHNHDICLVDLKEYNEDANAIYPSISIIIVNPF